MFLIITFIITNVPFFKMRKSCDSALIITFDRSQNVRRKMRVYQEHIEIKTHEGQVSALSYCAITIQRSSSKCNFNSGNGYSSVVVLR